MNWYCVHVRAAKEAQTATFLRERFDLETYFPRLKKERVLQRASRLVIEPLFPRYLFCRMDLPAHYRAVRYAPEVVDIVHFGQQPAVVDDALIAKVKNWESADGSSITSASPLLPGMRVEIVTGPMQGLDGTFLHEMSNHERVAILLANLNCSASVVVNRRHLKCVA